MDISTLQEQTDDLAMGIKLELGTHRHENGKRLAEFTEVCIKDTLGKIHSLDDPYQPLHSFSGALSKILETLQDKQRQDFFMMQESFYVFEKINAVSAVSGVDMTFLASFNKANDYTVRPQDYEVAPVEGFYQLERMHTSVGTALDNGKIFLDNKDRLTLGKAYDLIEKGFGDMRQNVDDLLEIAREKKSSKIYTSVYALYGHSINALAGLKEHTKVSVNKRRFLLDQATGALLGYKNQIS